METQINRLPATLPIFPLPGVLLLPRSRLPLNIFEPRYINMTDDALAADRLIGMIQPLDETSHPAVYQTGCVGRITSFAEEGNRYLITLTGLCRFDLVEEVPTMRGYRRIIPDWTPYYGDFVEENASTVDRARLIASLKVYFRASGLTTDWSAIENASNERLVHSISMLCPFSPLDKQALLQAKDLCDRAKLLIGLIETAALQHGPGDHESRH